MNPDGFAAPSGCSSGGRSDPTNQVPVRGADMANPLKTEHALDWGKTAQEIEDQFQAGMIERDRYRDALENISQERPRNSWVDARNIAREALKGIPCSSSS